MSSIVSNVSKTVITSFTCSGSLLNTSSVNWSQNNSVAIITSGGLYVFESHFDPNESTQQFPYHKAIIPVPSETINFDCGLYVTELMTGSTLDEQHLLMLDQTLATETSNAPNFRNYRSAQWSPLCGQHGCLLALLTLDHRLVIYRKMKTKWQLSIDLSVLLNERMKESWDAIDSPNYSIYKERVYSLATVAFCWTRNWFQSNDNSKTCVLYLGSKNGLITFWNISIDEQISAQLVYKWKTNLDQITCLKCFEDFLIISAYNGLVSVIHKDFCLDDSPNPLLLWSEEDQIGVNHLAVKRIDRNTFDVVFAKSVFVVICRMSAEKTIDSITMNLKCCKSVLGLHEMPATGLCSIIESKYLLTSMDGRLVEIEVSPDLSIKQCEVALDSISSSAMCPYGIDSSPNASLCALVQSLSVYHDHLVIKEPIQIVVFSNISFDYLTHILYEQYLSQTSIAKNVSIIECSDYLDLIRAFLSNNQYSSHDSLLFSLISNEDLITNCEDLVKLRIIRFIVRAYVTNSKSKANDSNSSLLKSRAQLCEDMILKLFIQNLYSSLICDSESLSSLTSSQVLSLKNMNSWLSQRFDIEIIDKNEINFESITELCPICKEEIEFVNKNSGSCSKSHHFLRCTNSLVLCDFLNYKYDKCVRCCNNFLIKPPIWKQFSICLYCD